MNEDVVVVHELKCTKVCPDPHCEAVWHNCPNTEKYCKDCGHRIIKINEKTFEKKFQGWFFQYDYNTGEYLRLKIYKAQTKLEL